MNASSLSQPETSDSRWPHRLAWLLACAALVQIGVGATVTTYEAGMAIGDWPTADGYWLSPPAHWAKSFDRFLAQGHRTLGPLVVALSVALAAALWMGDRRRWLRWMGGGLVLGLACQGILGGLRVIFAERLLATLHGCTAPLWFGLCAAMVAVTSRAWQQPARSGVHPSGRRLRRLAWAAPWLVYVQIVLCAQLRHMPLDAGPGWFSAWVPLVLIAAGLITGALAWLLLEACRHAAEAPMLMRRARRLCGLFALQLLLGAGAWVALYGLPRSLADRLWPIGYTVVAEGRLQVLVTTAHTVAGPLTLAAAISLALWSRRILR